jgi:hypothetical protein
VVITVLTQGGTLVAIFYFVQAALWKQQNIEKLVYVEALINLRALN